MKKQLAIAIVAIMLTSVLIVSPVMASTLRDNMTIDVGGKQVKLIEHKENNIGDIIERGHVQSSLRGQLYPYTWDGQRVYLSATMRVEITIDHTPTDATGVFLGVWDDDLTNGVYIIDDNQDGHAHFPSSGTYTIPESGYYWIVVGALEDGFSYDGWYDVYW